MKETEIVEVLHRKEIERLEREKKELVEALEKMISQFKSAVDPTYSGDIEVLEQAEEALRPKE